MLFSYLASCQLFVQMCLLRAHKTIEKDLPPYHEHDLATFIGYKVNWNQINSKPPTIPLGIVTCTFSDNLSRNSCKP